MLPKKSRLSRKEILVLRAGNPVLQGHYFGLIYSPRTEKKIGVIVSAKIAKSAVVRNRIKRNLFRAVENQELKPGWYLFLAKKPAVDAGLEEIQKELAEFKQRL